VQRAGLRRDEDLIGTPGVHLGMHALVFFHVLWG
jgi:hypothetical protein